MVDSQAHHSFDSVGKMKCAKPTIIMIGEDHGTSGQEAAGIEFLDSGLCVGLKTKSIRHTFQTW